ncbi:MULTISPECIES: histidinol-phosphate transaminase [unclassified Synechocystis]|uniref:histidinol-phosphate transaminase n=1 Tax=unclassified Synechocystis TaxID=2640012 RepID=UPI00048E2E8F|nr:MULTISPECIES: histidinol-phosphate transaminase [unclassified Synechocystis]MCT0254556.1 histidinol-phosphate transaminase [Synechocystis sp. CS-94]
MVSIRLSVRQTPAYVPGEQPQTNDFVKLNTNENPYAPPAQVLEAVAAELPKVRLYPDPVSTQLRRTAASLYGVQLNQVLAGNGSDDILNIVVRTFVDPGETVAFLDLTYSLYETIASVHGAKVQKIATDDNFDLTGPVICPEAKLIFLASPNPPKGKHLNREFLWQTCAQAQGVVVIDEAYGDFSDEDHWDFLKEFDNVIISRTLSKSYSLAGMRVGLAIAAPALIEEMDKVRDSYNLDRLAQALGTAALQAQAEFVPLWQMVRNTRIRLMEQLAKMDFQVCESDANFVFAAPRWIAAAELYQVLKERKILVRYFNHPRITNYLRITVGTDGEIDQLLSAIASVKQSLE